MFNKILILLSFLFISACGSSGGDSSTNTPTDTNQTFDLSKLQSTTLGTVYTTQLTGSDSNSINYSGSFSIANRAQTMLNGVLVTPHDLLISLTGNSSITVTATSYVGTNGNLISIVVQTTGVTCTPASPDSFPNSVKIGDFGIRSTLTCSDNTTNEGSWRIEDGGNNTINLVSSAVVKDQFNAIVSTTDVTYKIDINGNIVSFSTSTNISSNNFTLTYQST